MSAGALREPADGGSATPPRPLRDRPLVRVGLLALVLVAAAGVARSCGSHGGTISQAEAVEIARDNAAFTPCEQQGCVMVRAVQRGLPTRLVWIVGLAEDLDANGVPTRVENFLIDARTGDLTR
jgi:hypothetical protein